MKITNKHGLPEPIVRAVKNDPYTYSGHISVTQLIKPPRQRWLEIRHDDELEVDVVDRLWTLMGSAVHGVLEQAEDKHSEEIMEARVTHQFGDYLVSGKPDLWTSPDLLQDYKFTTVWSTIKGLKSEWEQQLNMLAYLYRSVGFEVNRAEVVAIYRDWSRAKAAVDKSYPQLGAEVVPVPLWKSYEVEDFILDRLKKHMSCKEYSDAHLPQCTPEEMWQKETTYAVMKNNNKRATRVFDLKLDAQELAAELEEKGAGKDTYTIVERPGECTRCEHYCSVKNFCNQYLDARGHGELLE